MMCRKRNGRLLTMMRILARRDWLGPRLPRRVLILVGLALLGIEAAMRR